MNPPNKNKIKTNSREGRDEICMVVVGLGCVAVVCLECESRFVFPCKGKSRMTCARARGREKLWGEKVFLVCYNDNG